MRVGLDFDGVIADTIPSMISYARNHLGVNLRPEDCVVPGGPQRLGTEGYRELVRVTHETPFSLTFQPTRGAVEWLPRIAAEHELVLVTARHQEAFTNAERWLDAHGFASCFAARHSSGTAAKSVVVELLSLDCYVDDLIPTFIDWPLAVTSLLWDAPYNRSRAVGPRVQRIAGWNELKDWITVGGPHAAKFGSSQGVQSADSAAPASE